MADNKVANAGSGGATFATDDIAGVDYPRGKITLGVDGVSDGDVSSTNPLPVSQRADSGAVTSVATSTTSATLIAANTSRKGLAIYNDGDEDLAVRCEAAAASFSALTFAIGPKQFFVMPVNYTGQVRGVLRAGSGNARITEFT